MLIEPPEHDMEVSKSRDGKRIHAGVQQLSTLLRVGAMGQTCNASGRKAAETPEA